MVHVGCVLYTKGDQPGSLDARWCEVPPRIGTGKATGGPAEGYAGHYSITYFDERGREDWVGELVIEDKGDHYQLTWLRNGEVTGSGVGMETAEGLAAGYL
jgi:hypothetical protein